MKIMMRWSLTEKGDGMDVVPSVQSVRDTTILNRDVPEGEGYNLMSATLNKKSDEERVRKPYSKSRAPGNLPKQSLREGW